MKHRVRHYEKPADLFRVLENIIYDLEERSGGQKDDLVIEALMALMVLVEHEHDQRKAADPALATRRGEAHEGNEVSDDSPSS